MSNVFDPYHVWLGISPQDRPVDHYRLLGLARFESDLDVIENAADRQMAHVQRHKIGPHSADSQRLLNELATAKGVLMHRERKATYDRELQARLAAASAALGSQSMANLATVTRANPASGPPGARPGFAPPQGTAVAPSHGSPATGTPLPGRPSATPPMAPPDASTPPHSTPPLGAPLPSKAAPAPSAPSRPARLENRPIKASAAGSNVGGNAPAGRAPAGSAPAGSAPAGSAPAGSGELFDFVPETLPVEVASQLRRRQLSSHRHGNRALIRKLLFIAPVALVAVVALAMIVQHHPTPPAAPTVESLPTVATSGGAAATPKRDATSPRRVAIPASRPKDPFDTRLEAGKPNYYDLLKVVRASQELPPGWKTLDQPAQALRFDPSAGPAEPLLLGLAPPAEYAIRTFVKREADAEVDIELLSADARFVLTIDGWANNASTAPQMIDGRSGDANASARHEPVLAPDTWSELTIIVLHSGVAVECDGQRMYAWSLGFDRLGASDSYPRSDPPQISLFGAKGSFAVRSVQLRSLSGEPPTLLPAATPRRSPQAPPHDSAAPGPAQVATAGQAADQPQTMTPQPAPAQGVAGAAAGGAAPVRDTQTGGARLLRPSKTLPIDSDGLTFLAISPGAQGVVCGSARAAAVFDLKTGGKLAAPTGGQQIIDAAFTADGQRLILMTKQSLIICRVDSGQTSEGPHVSGTNVALARDASLAAAFDPAQRTWAFFDPVGGQSLGATPELTDRGANSVARLSPGARYVCLLAPPGAAGPGGAAKKLIDLKAGKEIPCEFGDAVKVAAFSSTGKLALSRSSPPYETRIYDLDAGSFQPGAIVGPKDEPISSLAFSANGALLLCGGAAGSLRIYNARTAELWGVCVGHRGEVKYLAAASDSATAVSADPVGGAFVWPLPQSADVPAGASVVQRDPPGDADQKSALDSIKEAFSDDYAKARKPAEKAALAQKFLDHAAADPLPAEKYMLYCEARDLARSAGEPLLLLQALDAMTREFKMDYFAMVGDELEFCARSTTSPQSRADLIGALSHVADRAVAEENFDAANKLLATAVAVARKLNVRDPFVKTVLARQADVKEQSDQAQKVKAAEARLAQGDDPEASLTLGAYYCFFKGDWDAGLPYLARSSDAGLKKVALAELVPSKSPLQQAQLGEGWQSAAESATGRARAKYLARAAHWYRTSLPGLEGLAAVKVKKRLAEVDAASEK